MKLKTDDVYGLGLSDYYNGKRNARFKVYSDIAETEIWDISLFFRTIDQMPECEKIALDNASGRILDVGAGAGSHSLILQEQGKSVTAIDRSEERRVGKEC